MSWSDTCPIIIIGDLSPFGQLSLISFAPGHAPGAGTTGVVIGVVW